MQDCSGCPLRPGEPEYTDDDRFWDGARLYQLIDDDVRKHHRRLLSEADVLVFNLLDCTPHSPRLGFKRLAGASEQRQIVEVGLVRFVEEEGCLQRWESEDGGSWPCSWVSSAVHASVAGSRSSTGAARSCRRLGGWRLSAHVDERAIGRMDTSRREALLGCSAPVMIRA